MVTHNKVNFFCEVVQTKAFLLMKNNLQTVVPSIISHTTMLSSGTKNPPDNPQVFPHYRTDFLVQYLNIGS